MANENALAFGIYGSLAEAQSAVDRLRASGIPPNRVSVLLPETLSPQAVVPDVVQDEATNVVPGATVAGVMRGSLAMLAIGAFSIPLLGPFIVAGPILASFGKFELGAVGGLIGALVGMGIPAPDATHYEGRVKEGGVLLTVHSDTADDAVKAMDLLKATGAEHVSSPVTTAAGATISN